MNTSGIANCYGYNPTGRINIQDDNGESTFVPVLYDTVVQGTSNGGPKSCLIPGAVAKPINVTTGNMYYNAPPDAQVKGRGPDLTFSRMYNSQSHIQGLLGAGWTFPWETRLQVIGNGFVRIQDDQGKARIYAERADGKYYGVLDDLGIVSGDVTNGFVWKMNAVEYEFSEQGRLNQISSPGGDVLLLTYNTTSGRLEKVSYPNNRGLYFVTNSAKKITEIYYLDDLGNPLATPVRTFTYTVDKAFFNMLTEVRDGSGNLIEEYIYTGKYPRNLSEVRRYLDPVNYEVIEKHTYDSEDRALTSEVGTSSGLELRTLDYSIEGQTTVTDSQSRQQIFVHDGPWQVTSVTGDGCSECGSGSFGTFSYDAYGNITSMTDNKETSTTSFTYDARGNTLTRTEAVGLPEEHTTTYEYHPDYDLVTKKITESVLNPGNDHIITYDYHNAQGTTTPYLYAVIDEGYTYFAGAGVVPYQYETQYSYNIDGQVTTIDGPRTDVQDITSFTYHPFTGDLEIVTDPVGNTTTFTDYDLRGNPGTITDANGVATIFSYDSEGRITMVTVTDPGGGAAAMSSFHDPLASASTATTKKPKKPKPKDEPPYADAVAKISENLDLPRDLKGLGEGVPVGAFQTMSVAGFTSETTIYNYLFPAGSDLLESIQLPSENALSFSYDDALNLFKIRDSNGNSIVYSYDSEGNRTSEQVSDGSIRKEVNYLYDPLNRLEFIYNSHGYSTAYSYDANGNRERVTSPDGRQVDYTFDALNRLKTALQGGTYTTNYDYDSADNLQVVTDAGNITTIYYYDDAGRLVQTSSPDEGTIQYQYDKAGNLVFKRDGGGMEVKYEYDAANRLTLIDYPTLDDPHNDQYFTYDQCTNGKGRLCSKVDVIGTTEYQYDFMGRITMENYVNFGFTTQYSYYPGGALASMTYPQGDVVEYNRDVTGAVDQLLLTLGGNTYTIITDTTPHPFRGYDSITFYNGFTWNFGYDLDGSIETLGLGNLVSRYYSRPNGGEIRGIDDPAYSLTYWYDSLGHLDFSTGNFGSIAYSYDGVGNRLMKNINGEQTDYFYTSSTNRLEAASGTEAATYSYHGNGDLFSTDGWEYFTDFDGPIQWVQKDGGYVSSYYHDAFRRRVLKHSCGQWRIFIYDQFGNIISEFWDGTSVATNFYMDGMRIAAFRDEYKDNVCTPLGEDEGYRLSESPTLEPDRRTFLSSETLHVAAWSAAVSNTPSYITTAECVLEQGGTVVTIPLTLDSTGSFVGSSQLSAYPDPFWNWSVTISDNADNRYYRRGIITVSTTANRIPFGPSAWFSIYANDHLGTPLHMTIMPNQPPVWTGKYLPFGELYFEDTDPDGDGIAMNNPFRFPGQYHDRETGLYYNYFRDYSPKLGRYVEPDPIGLDIFGELFSYTSANPVNYIDPFGLSKVIFDRSEKRMYVYWDNGSLINTLRAGNNTTNPGGDPCEIGSNAPAPLGTFPVRNPLEKNTPAFGPYFFPIGGLTKDGKPSDIASKRELGIHAGRNGPESRTLGCIRVSEQSIYDLFNINQMDPITQIEIRE